MTNLRAQENRMVTVGIPTYEASDSLVAALHSIYSQTAWDQICEVMVVVDGSRVSAEVLEKIANPKLQITYSAQREGQSARINDIIGPALGDLIVLTNDDVILDKEAIAHLVESWQESGADLLAGRVMPLPSQGMVEEILEMQNRVTYRLISYLGDTYLAANGRLLALAKNFAKTLNLPRELKNNDAYIYVSAKTQNRKFTFVPEARCYFRNPQSLKEYFKQSVKFQRSLDDNKRFFKEDISKYYVVSTLVLLKAVFFVLLRYPIRSVFYILLIFYARGLSMLRKKSVVNQSGVWETDKSTKTTIQSK
jgi:glycosyltransferase involved in cell wall biosynthesis